MLLLTNRTSQITIDIQEETNEQKEFIIKFKEDFNRIKESPSNRDELADCLFMEAYMKYGNLAEVSRRSEINYQTCKKRLNKLRQKYNGN